VIRVSIDITLGQIQPLFFPIYQVISKPIDIIDRLSPGTHRNPSPMNSPKPPQKNPLEEKKRFPLRWILFLMVVAAIVIAYAPSMPSSINGSDLLTIWMDRL
jgi:hypothetical protein